MRKRSAPSQSGGYPQKRVHVGALAVPRVVPRPRHLTREIKSVDCGSNNWNFNKTPSIQVGFGTTGTGGYLSGIATGAAGHERIGKKVNYRSLHLRGFIYPGTSAAFSSRGIRLLVVYDRQTNGVSPGIADVLLANASAAGQNSNARLVTTGLNMGYKDRFKVLIDETFTAPAANMNGSDIPLVGFQPTSSNSFNVNRFVKLRDLEGIYLNGTMSADYVIANQLTGGIFMFLISDDTDITGGMIFDWSARVRFEDV